MEPTSIRMNKLKKLAKAEAEKQKAIADAKHEEFLNWKKWLKDFIKRAPTLCQYCELMLAANIAIPVAKYHSGYKYDRDVTFSYHQYSFGNGIVMEDPNTGGCGCRHDMIGHDGKFIRSENCVSDSLAKADSESDRDDKGRIVRFAKLAAEWETELIALIDKL